MNNIHSVAIHQPNFLPWIGFFLKMSVCDVFVFLDDVQFTRKRAARADLLDRRQQTMMVSIPVSLPMGFETTYSQAIPIYDRKMCCKILNRIKENYQRSPGFKYVFPLIEDRLNKKFASLADLNITLIKDICEILGLHINTIKSSEIQIIADEKNNRNMEIVKYLGGELYYSGEGGQYYNNPDIFESNYINIAIIKPAKETLKVILPEELGLSIVHQIFTYGPGTVREELENLRKHKY
jgi:hypothetical protein